MDNLFMFDAFKALDSLNEDTFKVDDEGIEELSEFEKMDDIDDSVEIIDMHADDEEELEDSYIGKVVLACNVCDSKIFEDKENVVISEENPDSANVDMECPYCHTLDGFKVIGQIGEYCADCNHEDEHTEDEEIEVEKEESEELEEGKHKEFTSEDDIDADMDDEKEEARKRWERKKNDARSKRDYRMKHDLEEDFKERHYIDVEGLFNDDAEDGAIISETELRKIWDEGISGKDELLMTYHDEDGMEFEDWVDVSLDNGYLRVADGEDLEEELEDDDAPKKRTRKKKPLFDSLFDEIYVQLAKTPYSPASYFHRGVYSDISSAADGRDIQLGVPSRTEEYVNGYDTIRIQYNANEESHIPFDFAKKLADKYGLTYRTSPDGVYLYIDIPENAPALNKPVVYRGEFIERGDLEEDFKDDKEVIVPVSAGIKAEIKFDSKEEEVKDENSEEGISEKDAEAEEESSKDESSVEYDFEEMDEGSFDELAESYLKTIYSNVESYKTTNAEATKDKFMIEGLITFASGAVKNTNFVFTPKAATKSGKLQFIGENLQITKNRNAFKFNASISDKKLLGESLTYNYSTKDGAGKMRKLYGTIKRK